MNAQPRRNRRTAAPIVTLACAAIVGVIGLGTAGADAQGVPTPSETSLETTTLPAAPPIVDAALVVPVTVPTGTTLPVAP